MANYNLKQLSFMTVDDNAHMCALVKSILIALGVKNVMDASNGEEAFKKLRLFSADIVICDWNMEPMDGIDFTKKIRNSNESPNVFVPIIMLTGHTEMKRVVEARNAGINEFLAKPISVKSLYSRIRSIIEKPRPFIRVDQYFGPDRRRRGSDTFLGTERRVKDEIDTIDRN